MPKVGIEQSLTDVQQELEARGYDIVQLKDEQDAQDCDCCVITGQDENMMGIHNTVTAGSVINAEGMSAQDICQKVEQKLGHLQ